MKLILINGPTGIGKSTIAEMVHKEFLLSFLLEIDAQRRYINKYKENPEESLAIVLSLSLAIVDNHLKAGRDVIIDKVFVDSEVSDEFLNLGKKYGADTYEFILNTDKNSLINRAEKRGFIEGSMLTPEKVVSFWERMQEYIKNRPKAIVLDTKDLTVEETFKYIQKNILG